MSAPDGSPVGAERSIGQLFASATTEMSSLVHDEIALAKAQLKQDVKRGAISGGAFAVAGAVLIFSLPMLSFALAYGIRTWSDWNLAICFLLSFAANVLVAAALALIGVVFAKKAKKSKGPQKVAASVKETAGVLQNAKPHPRELPAQDRVPEAIEAVARSSS
ncbi:MULTISPECIES: phage holin family protein [unclassified Streptomyces]|uniref:phage holin family protein n=1 Tax=unclassified Streptomyces TaxID=2593676 RepID=UPI002258E7E3|nr:MULTISPECIES: phage holin family protein [unclassified Streptomyces]WTB39538.1 phage holin family protein [Streptomyces sp. NBC_00827]WUC12944.1 phage holin family protein [Streptomyces sp. NBC_00564]WUC50554.1 phage holin family protein [Streptomyces sp. NBC_00554]MCX4972610.1 phage holin family protein [Streptomyces sp. NBC_00620]WRZ20851.1 phage holin family protein [Streptomyces sp. NBC_00243]